MILPIEAHDSFFAHSAKVPDKLKKHLIPAAEHRFSEDKDGAILDQRIQTPDFTAWVHNIWLVRNTLLHPFSVKNTWALHYWLARKIPAALDQGNLVMVDDCTLFYLSQGEYTAWPIIGNAVSFHINFNDEIVSRLAGDQLNKETGLKLDASGSRLINAVPFPLNPVTYRTIKRILTCPFKGETARIYFERNFTNLFELFLNQLRNNTSGYRLMPFVRQIINYIRADAQHYPGKIESYEQAARKYGIEGRVLRSGFESCFHTPLHDYVLREKLNTAFHLLCGTSLTYAEIARQSGYGFLPSLQFDFSQYFTQPMEYFRSRQAG